MSPSDLDLFLRYSIAACGLVVLINAFRFSKQRARSIAMILAAALLALWLQMFRSAASVLILAVIGVIIFAILALDLILGILARASSTGGPK